LDTTWTAKELRDAVEVLGETILHCSVAFDEYGMSKGFGYVIFEEQAAALRAIEKFNLGFTSPPISNNTAAMFWCPREKREQLRSRWY